jgi:hypothetical protein
LCEDTSQKHTSSKPNINQVTYQSKGPNKKQKENKEKWLYLLTLIICCRRDGLCRLDKKLSRLKKPGQNDVYTQKAAFRIRHNHEITSMHLTMTRVIGCLYAFPHTKTKPHALRCHSGNKVNGMFSRSVDD